MILMEAVLSFFDVVSSIAHEYNLPFCVLPSESIIYRCILSSTTLPISRICAILDSYKRDFTYLKRKSHQKKLSFSSGKVSDLNDFIIVIVNVFWHGKLFEANLRKLTKPCPLVLPKEVLAQIDCPHISTSLSIKLHPALVSMCAQFLSEIEQFQGVEPNSLLPENINTNKLRQLYLKYLEKRGLGPLVEFVTGSIKVKSKKS